MSAAAVLCGDLNMLRCFVGAGIPTVVVASGGKNLTALSRHCASLEVIAPLSDERLAVAQLCALAQTLGDREPPVLFYGTDAMLLLISRHRDEIERYYRFRVPPAPLIEALVDKARFAELGHQLKLPVPRTLASDSIARAADIENGVGLPCVFKPSVHIGWFQARAAHGLSPHKAVVAENRAELEKNLDQIRRHSSSFVVQEYVRGGEDRIYSYHAYLDGDSTPLCEFSGKKVRTYPQHAGVSTLLELVKDSALIELGREVCRRAELVGPVKLDFKRDAVNERTFLLEINARFTLWNHLGAANGVNLPLIAYRDLVGAPITPPGDFRTDVRWLSFGNDLRAYLRDYRRGGELSLRQWLGSLKGPMVYDIFAWDDPLPFAKNAVDFSLAFLSRVFNGPRAPS
jgi:D-aspartate ligase